MKQSKVFECMKHLKKGDMFSPVKAGSIMNAKEVSRYFRKFNIETTCEGEVLTVTKTPFKNGEPCEKLQASYIKKAQTNIAKNTRK